MSKSGYSVYLGKCLLPIAPSKIDVAIGNENRSISLINGSEINLLKGDRLREIEFSFIIPQIKYPFASYSGGFKGAKYFLDYFIGLKEANKPFQFIVFRSMPDGRPLFSSNIKVSMESLTVTEQAEEGFDITVKIKLKQYREYAAKTVNIKADSGTASVLRSRSDSTVQSSKPILIGSEVIVNGQLYGSSYGDAPGQLRSNFRGKVNFINLKGSHPYHITELNGGWLGWVKAECVRSV